MTRVWSEKEYQAYLEHERHMYAWCLARWARMETEAARSAALDFYPYEPPERAYRELVFHDEAWHWAMLRLFGEGYWRERPDLASPTEDYRCESEAFERCRDE